MQVLDFTLCYAIEFPGRESGFRAGFRPDSRRKFKNRLSGRPKAVRTADFEAFPLRNPPQSGPEGRLLAGEPSTETHVMPHLTGT